MAPESDDTVPQQQQPAIVQQPDDRGNDVIDVNNDNDDDDEEKDSDHNDMMTILSMKPVTSMIQIMKIFLSLLLHIRNHSHNLSLMILLFVAQLVFVHVQSTIGMFNNRNNNDHKCEQRTVIKHLLLLVILSSPKNLFIINRLHIGVIVNSGRMQ